MTTFDKREEAFEQKYARDEELQFRAAARRNKLLGLWAAEKMGLAADQAADYAKTVVEADLTETGDADVLAKVLADLMAAGIAQSEHQIRRTMDELMVTAIDQVRAGR